MWNKDSERKKGRDNGIQKKKGRDILQNLEDEELNLNPEGERKLDE